MHRQSVEQAMSLLSIVQQPAFCIRQNGTMISNEAAKYLSPSCSAALPQWLAEAKPVYDLWDRAGHLLVQIGVQGSHYAVTIHALQDGTLFLMAPCDISTPAENALSVASQVIRQPLSELSALASRADRGEEPDGARFHRQLLRMSRIVSNLTEVGRLNTEDPRLHFSDTDTLALQSELFDEIETHCRSMERPFLCTMPKKPLHFYADVSLLHRALLNLISNAIKFSPAGSPVSVHVESIGTHLVFQVENQCSESSSELLRTAFNRLSQRQFLPKVSWGIGLGLPIASAIARLHGGMVAVETLGGKATVSLSISLRTREVSALSHSMMVDYTGGIRQSILELSDVLPVSAFETK